MSKIPRTLLSFLQRAAEKRAIETLKYVKSRIVFFFFGYYIQGGYFKTEN